MTLVFERIAQRRYGDALLGVLLRQLNLTRLGLQAGSLLFVPTEEAIRQIPIEPLSHVLQTTEEQDKLFLELVEKRSNGS